MKKGVATIPNRGSWRALAAFIVLLGAGLAPPALRAADDCPGQPATPRGFS